MNSVCVFCGSSPGADPVFQAAVAATGREIARRGVRLVYGGGNVGLMGAVADAALAAGGVVIGVIPDALLRKEVAHAGLTELLVVRSMHERKATMADLADGFLALPGGFGTIEEFVEVLTWAQLGLHDKPCGLLNVAGFYDPLLAMFDRAVEQRFLRAEHRGIVRTGDSVADLLDRMAGDHPWRGEKWLDREAR